jgi:ribosomal protein S1
MHGNRAWVDAGFHSLSEVYLPDLDINHVVTPASSAPMATRRGVRDLRVGDVVALRVDTLYTPYGDMQLQPLEVDESTQLRARWSLLVDSHASGALVPGRVLNQCRGGYAVGVAGFVGLLPYHRAAPETIKRVGELQSFYIERVDQAKRFLQLADVRLFPKGAPGKRGVSASGGRSGQSTDAGGAAEQ